MENNLKDIFEASYENPKDARKRLENIGFTYDTELSSPDTKIFYDKEGKPHITFRGTHRAEDVLTDIKVGLGMDTKRHKEARDITKKVQEKYKKPVSVYGTSLGGHIAEQSGGQNIFTYNKATGIKDIFKTLPKSQKDYRTEKDVISFPSLFQRGGQKITIQSPINQDILSAHSTKAFNINKKKTILSGNIFSKYF